MSYLASLRQRRKSQRATEHLLRISVGSDRYIYHMVVEGEEDEEYYGRLAESMFPGVVFQIVVCDGKGGVLGLRDFADRELLGDAIVLYFIDRDHDDFIQVDQSRRDTYVTDGYSVEWNVCSIDVLAEVFKKNCVISNEDPVLNLFERFRDACLGDVSSRLRSVMAFVIASRRADSDPDLDELTLHNLFEFDNSRYVRRCVTFDELADRMGLDVIPECGDIRDVLRRLYHLEPKYFLRGKMILSLYCDIMGRFISTFKPSKMNGRLLRPRIQIGRRTFMHLAMDIVQMPDSLRIFFEGSALKGVVASD